MSFLASLESVCCDYKVLSVQGEGRRDGRERRRVRCGALMVFHPVWPILELIIIFFSKKLANDDDEKECPCGCG